MSLTKITAVDRGSPAKKAGVKPGEILTEVNGHAIADVLDYKYYTYESRLTLTLADGRGNTRTVRVGKEDGEDPGLNFETYLMDGARSCANRCVFCFVDQLPPGMRETLYFKDDDARLSFLMGNYITLTNLSGREAQRIIDLRISPINISVHATDPELRNLVLGNRNAGRGLELMRRFAAANITMNCQIVACPGLNDGPQLQKSMEDLAALYPRRKKRLRGARWAHEAPSGALPHQALYLGRSRRGGGSGGGFCPRMPGKTGHLALLVLGRVLSQGESDSAGKRIL